MGLASAGDNVPFKTSLAGSADGISLIPSGRVFTFFDDFLGETTISETAGVATYLTTVIEAGGGEGSAVMNDVAGGGLLITTDAAATDSTVVTTNPEVFSFSATKRFEMEFSFQAEDDDLGIFLGLGEGLLFGVDGVTLREDSHVGFLLEGDSVLTFSYGNTSGGNVTTDTAIAFVPAADTIVTAMYDGAGGWTAFVDGVASAAITNTAASHPDALMSVFLALENSGVAAAQTMTVNYIYLRWEL